MRAACVLVLLTRSTRILGWRRAAREPSRHWRQDGVIFPDPLSWEHNLRAASLLNHPSAGHALKTRWPLNPTDGVA